MTTYLLDANVFITAKNAHYGFDFVPAFWEWIEQQHAAGAVMTVQSVVGEVLAGRDELAAWMKARPASFGLRTTAADVPVLARLSAWATTAPVGFTLAAQAEFLASADYRLVAQAATTGYTVVTHETRNALARKRVKIPDACSEVGASWTTPFAMLRAEGARFVL